MTAAPSELRDLVREWQWDTVRDLGPQGTWWLAVSPLWTRSVAETAGFPVEKDQSVLDFVQRARAAGWCKTRGSLRADAPAELRFWMPDEVRRDILGILQERENGGLHAVQRYARDVATRVVSHADEVDLPGALRAWAELCVEVEPDEIPARVLGRVIGAVVEGDLGRAQEFLNAGRALETVVEGTADQQLRRARLVLDRGLERRRDDVALSRYLDRPALSDAVAGLLAPDAGKWALHLRGVGGVGKSMFIRYLRSGKFAEARKLPPIPMACVNFDRVSPDYPATKPVQLLLELADELAPYAAVGDKSDQAERALRRFYDKADTAHRAPSSVRDEAMRPLGSPEVGSAIDAFAHFVDTLGGALLILDTCEELAKWSPGNADSAAVLDTLEILDRLHGQVGTVRVLLAGRRPLPAREWLDERAVMGFTVEEARQYLALYGDRPLAADLVDEIIRQSRAVDVDEPDPEPGQMPAWVNPFDLALYRAWADEDPDLSMADIRQGNDAYIESRIIPRLDDPLVRRSLPMLAVGGQCRIETIATALDCDADAAASLSARLAAQEWITPEGGTPPVFVTAWPSMAERLRRYYHAADRQAEFSQAAGQFAEVIARRLSGAPRASMDTDEVLTALRWARQPAEAARLWDLIAAHAAAPPDRWETVREITDRIVGAWREEEWPTTAALRATVLATHIAAHRRKEEPLAEVQQWWEQVLASAAAHPDPARRGQLRVLGALGELPYRPGETSLWDVLRAEQGSLKSSPEVGTAAIDTLHRLLEAGHAAAAGQLLGLLNVESFRFAFPERPGASPVPLRAAAGRPIAWALVAEARLLADSDRPAARDRLIRAEQLASDGAGANWAWPYWLPPRDLLARVRIERGLIDSELIPRRSELTVLGPWEDYARGHLGSVDGERLASLCLQLRLRHGTVRQTEAQRWEEADGDVRDRVATNSAHDLVPPLFVSVADAWLSAGKPERGLDLLERRRSEANAAGDDDATIRHADAAIVRLTRRLRLTNQRSFLNRLVNPAEYQSEVGRLRIGTLDDARRAWAVIYREVPPDAQAETDRVAGWHAWWQCQFAEPPIPIPLLPWSPGNPGADLVALDDIRVDLTEMRKMHLLGRLGLEQVREQLDVLLEGLDGTGQARARSVPPVRSADPHHALRLALRRSALDALAYPGVAQAPGRLIAELAFEEAELLALRLPAAAAALYLVAANGYLVCDPVGRLLALAAFHDALSACSAGERSALPAGSAAAQTGPSSALKALNADQPELAAALAGPPEDAGPWRYWAETVQRAIGDPSQLTPAGTTQVPAGLARVRISPRHLAAAMARRRAVRRVTATLRALLAVLATPLAVVLVGRIRPAFRLAAERGLGAARIETLNFDAAIGVAASHGPGGSVRLRVRPRPWRSAPVLTWSRLRLGAVNLAVWLLRSCWPGSPLGYSGSLQRGTEPPGAEAIRWTTPLDSPRDAWWYRQRQIPVTGTIRTEPAQAGQPWEHFLAASLGPAAAGRVEWVRLVAGQVPPADAGGRDAELIAAPAWARLLAGHYPRPESPQVRHVIGRAVRTAIGPCMIVSGEPASGSGEARRLEVRHLTRGGPLAVVLQAEPTVEEVDATTQSYDLADKMRLATDLLGDGVPAVLILPALPARLADEVARMVTAFAGIPGRPGTDIQAGLLRPLRTAIAPHVRPALLDYIILFLNSRYA